MESVSHQGRVGDSFPGSLPQTSTVSMDSTLDREIIDDCPTLLIRNLICKNTHKNTIASFEALSLNSAGKKDVETVQFIANLLLLETNTSEGKEDIKPEDWVPLSMRKEENSLEDFICLQIHYVKKIVPRDQVKYTSQPISIGDTQNMSTILKADDVLSRLLNKASELKQLSGEIPYTAFCQKYKQHEILRWLQQGMGDEKWDQLLKFGKIQDRKFLESLSSDLLYRQKTPVSTKPGCISSC